MSHYTVAVFLRDGASPEEAVEKLLAPYDENLPAEEEIDEDYPYGDKDNLLEKGLLNKAGDLFSALNQDAQWDWYVIGGRWHGELILKHGKTGIRGTPAWCEKQSKNYDGAYVRDIDFESMRKQARERLTPYDEMLKDEWLGQKTLADYRDEEEYIQRNITFQTYAVITPDGKWYAPGKVCWFGLSSETAEVKRSWDQKYYERFLKPALENNWYMVIVDCHI